MNSFIHIMIARSVRESIRKTTGMRINLAGFISGNVLPDIHPSLVRLPHYHSQSLPQIMQMTMLQNDPATANRRASSFAYALKAGIISHYLSDYFCFVHSPEFSGNMLQHHLYEMKMLFHFRKISSVFKKRYQPMSIRLKDMPHYIDSRIEEYFADEPRMALDLYYALEASTILVNSLLTDLNVHVAFQKSIRPANCTVSPL